MCCDSDGGACAVDVIVLVVCCGCDSDGGACGCDSDGGVL